MHDSNETGTRFASSIDSVGIMQSKAEALFLANNLLPPRYQNAARSIPKFNQAADKVSLESTSSAVKKELKLSNGDLSVRGDFGWHTRANHEFQFRRYGSFSAFQEVAVFA